LIICLIPIIIAIVIGPAINIAYDMLEDNKSFHDAFGSVFEYLGAFIFFNLIPFLTLSFFLGGYTFLQDKKTELWKVVFLCILGLTIILLLMIPAYYTVRSDTSSTAGLVYVFVPFYCLILLAVGFSLGWVLINLIGWLKIKVLG